MKWNAWFVSAKQAWQQSFLRWTTIATFAIVFLTSSYFLWRVLPAQKRSPNLITHYSVYLGIDQVQSWKWVWLLPLTWFLILLIDVVVAYGAYRSDPHFSYSLVFFACAWSLPWVLSLIYLARLNI